MGCHFCFHPASISVAGTCRWPSRALYNTTQDQQFDGGERHFSHKLHKVYQPFFHDCSSGVYVFSPVKIQTGQCFQTSQLSCQFRSTQKRKWIPSSRTSRRVIYATSRTAFLITGTSGTTALSHRYVLLLEICFVLYYLPGSMNSNLVKVFISHRTFCVGPRKRGTSAKCSAQQDKSATL